MHTLGLTKPDPAAAGHGASSPRPPHARLLVVDADPIAADSLAEFLTGEGYEVATAAG
ncbi:MAG: response regulator, partial [Phycisphaerales bacterium]|nr:response regulator [Phycisphaerales bacterium]